MLTRLDYCVEFMRDAGRQVNLSFSIAREPVTIETGIMKIQKIVSQPLTALISLGSPCIEAHNDFINPMRLTVQGRSSWPGICPDLFNPKRRSRDRRRGRRR